MADNTSADDAKTMAAFQAVADVLLPLSEGIRQRAYKAVGAILGYANTAVDMPTASVADAPAPARKRSPAASPAAAKRTPKPKAAAVAELSPKAFLAQKKPQTSVERIACIAYYLTVYRSTRRFKTADVAAVNAESGGAAFAHAASSVNNAARAGFLDTASRGLKELSAKGRQYVETLPDQAAAQEQMGKARRGRRKAEASKPTAAAQSDSSPKAFLAQKNPRSNVERVACLGYYLATNRSMARFKIADITALNAESGSAAFVHVASAVNNAARAGFLESASRGMKRLSAKGRQYVDTLPDQAVAKKQMRKSKARRGRAKAEASAAG